MFRGNIFSSYLVELVLANTEAKFSQTENFQVFYRKTYYEFQTFSEHP